MRHPSEKRDGGDRSKSSAKLNGIDPESYLRDVLSQRIEELLPWNVAASLKLPIRQAA
jgi:IS66 C-terminal element